MVIVVCVGVVFFMLGLILYGYYGWMKRVNTLRFRLERAHVQARVVKYDQDDLEALPEPVKRYFTSVLRDGQPLVSHVNITHSGTFNTGGGRMDGFPLTQNSALSLVVPALCGTHVFALPPVWLFLFVMPMLRAEVRCRPKSWGSSA